MKVSEAKMNLDITKEERELLLELLGAKDASMSHEIHHTDSREFRGYLKRRWELVGALKEKVENLVSAGETD